MKVASLSKDASAGAGKFADIFPSRWDWPDGERAGITASAKAISEAVSSAVRAVGDYGY